MSSLRNARSFAMISFLFCVASCGTSAVDGGTGGSATGGTGGTQAGTAGITGSAGTTGAAGSVGAGGTTGAAGTTGVGGGAAGSVGAGGAAGTTGEVGRGGALGTGGSGAGGRGGSSAGAGGGGRGGAAGSGAAGRGGTTGTGGGSGGATGTCPATVASAGDSTKNVMVGTLNRSYVLHIPSGYNGSKPLPLVIDFHPLGGTGSGQENSNGWKAKADSVGFIMAYPNSYNSNNSWNVGFCCQDAQKNQIDDVGFTRAMIQQIETIACVDTKRIYATGCSNGGGMTYKAACDLADIIAGAAPVDFRCVYGGSTQSPSCEGCKPARPISITHFDNTGDTALVPYNGGTTSFAADCPPNMSCVGMAFPSAQANFSSWQTIDGCTGSTSGLSGHSTCTTNMSCQQNAQVTMCVQQGGSHCGNYSSLGIVDIAWEMFQKQSLP